MSGSPSSSMPARPQLVLGKASLRHHLGRMLMGAEHLCCDAQVIGGVCALSESAGEAGSTVQSTATTRRIRPPLSTANSSPVSSTPNDTSLPSKSKTGTARASPASMSSALAAQMVPLQ